MRIAVLNGPNLNLLGIREPEIYGRVTLVDVERDLSVVAAELSVDIEFAQANGEGELVDIVQAYRGRVDGAVVNAGAYSHSSLALRDALVGVHVPYVEIHVSNIHAREPERHRTVLGAAAVGQVIGLGVHGYELALRGLVKALKSTPGE